MAYIVIAEVNYRDIEAEQAFKCGESSDIHDAEMVEKWNQLRGSKVKIFSEPTDGPSGLSCNGLKYYTCESNSHTVCEHIVDLSGLARAIEDSKLEVQRAQQFKEVSA